MTASPGWFVRAGIVAPLPTSSRPPQSITDGFSQMRDWLLQERFWEDWLSLRFAVALLELFAATTPTRVIALGVNRRKMFAVEIKPNPFLLLKVRSLVNLPRLVSLKSGDKFNNTRLIARLTFLRVKNGQPEPGSVLHTLAQRGAIAQAAFGRVMSRRQVIKVGQTKGGVARSHQRFRRWSGLLTREIGFTAAQKGPLTPARARGKSNHKIAGESTNADAMITAQAIATADSLPRHRSYRVDSCEGTVRHSSSSLLAGMVRYSTSWLFSV